MALKLVVRARGKGGLGTKSSCLFGPEGGTIGRGADCSWVLVDPRNEVSSHHATIVHEGGQFCLIDESTNGVFVNGSARPVGRGVKVALRHGDAFRIGQYDIGVILGAGSEDASASDLSVADGYGLADLVTGEAAPEPEGDGAGPAGYQSFAEASGRAAAPAETASHDPLAAFASRDAQAARQGVPPARGDSAALRARPPAVGPATEEDAAGGIAGNFSPQTVRQGAAYQDSVDADDFDRYLEGLATSSGPLATAPTAAPAPPVRHAAAAGIGAIDGAMTTLSPHNHNLWPLLESLGLTHTPLPDERVPAFLADVGAALRQVIDGLHAAYADAATGGDPTFRVATAQLQPLEDNPVKFAADADEAVEFLFGNRRAVHLGPRDAVRECLQGLQEHRLAVAAGTAAGLQAVIASFAPEALARRFAKYEPDRSGTRDRQWLWSMFEQYFDEVRRNRSHGLRRLFDEVFAQTYDRHIRDSLAAAPDLPEGGPAPMPPPGPAAPPPGPGQGAAAPLRATSIGLRASG